VHEQHLRRHADERDRRQIAGGIEAELGEQAWIDHERAADHKHRVAIGDRLGHQRGADIAAAARVVLHVELLAQPLRQRRRQDARHRVDRTTWRERRNQLHWPIGIVRRLREARRCEHQRGKQRHD
jgi:hypothetical protein